MSSAEIAFSAIAIVGLIIGGVFLWFATRIELKTKPPVENPGIEVTDAEYALLMKFPRGGVGMITPTTEELALVDSLVKRGWIQYLHIDGITNSHCRLTMLGRSVRIIVYKGRIGT